MSYNIKRVMKVVNDLVIICRDHDSHGDFNLVAGCYDKKMNLISMGFNSYRKTHPKQFHYSSKIGKINGCFIHAEISAIVNAKNNDVDTIVVAHYTNKVKNAKPCPSCMLAIKDAGIKNVYYTIADNEFGYIEVKYD